MITKILSSVFSCYLLKCNAGSKQKYLITGGTFDSLLVCKVLFFVHVTNLIGRVSPAEALIPSNTFKF